MLQTIITSVVNRDTARNLNNLGRRILNMVHITIVYALWLFRRICASIITSSWNPSVRVPWLDGRIAVDLVDLLETEAFCLIQEEVDRGGTKQVASRKDISIRKADISGNLSGQYYVKQK
jgi:hypothetical protein